MELATRASFYRMEREDVDMIVSFMQKQVKIPRNLKKAISKMKDYIEDSDTMMERFFELQKKRLRENAKREKMKKKYLEEQGLLNQAV